MFISDVFKRFSKSLETPMVFPNDTINNILIMAQDINDIIDSDSNLGIENPLIDEKPQMVAAAIVLYYLDINNIDVLIENNMLNYSKLLI